jgi:hypothetical protein
MKHNPGVGATADLSLRVSVATLVRVVFENPGSDKLMLALERKATLHETKVDVKSQPFGGAIRILDLNGIHDLIDDFHFDSERSRAEQDFRLFIRPSSWSTLREFCIQCLSHPNDPVLETDPTRELTEEFADTLKVDLQPGQYVLKPTGMIIEDKPAPTENFHARTSPTVRVYRIFEAKIRDTLLISAMMENSEDLSNQTLQEFTLADKQNGGNGWANAILTLPLKRLTNHYLSKSPHELDAPIWFEANQLDETVSAILEEISVPKYRRL